MRLFSKRKRPMHLGPYPLERLPRLSDPETVLNLRGDQLSPEDEDPGPQNAAAAYEPYLDIYDRHRHGSVAGPAPISEDLVERANNLKASVYFLNADMVGCAHVPQQAWVGTEHLHSYAVVTLVAHSPKLSGRRAGDDWIDGTRRVNADLRAAELAVVTASYIRHLGFDAVAHTPTATDVDIDLLALQCGLIELRSGELSAPYLSRPFSLSVVTTELELHRDSPLARRGLRAELKTTKAVGWMFGRGGTNAGIGRLNGDHRPLHLGKYPLERIKRVDSPTTLIIDDEIERVPVRAGGFARAANGDMGPKFEEDVKVFAFKTPQAQSYIDLVEAMTKHQDGEVSRAVQQSSQSPDENARSVKALAHHLGADMVGVCRVPAYAWYSHAADGRPIEPYHQNAVVVLIDQGYETMEAASGDDWVSGAQSMRAYMRGAQIAGIVAKHLRSLGHSARSHTNRDSDLLHIPLVLKSGLGEMSRVGELVLNPFLGPRFKSVIVTTDMAVTPDRPIDFGLQHFCGSCTKCARECPCGAIPFGDKVMFNGYETWKPDVEKCTKYRLGNQRGAACGRCMKTCPFNTEGILSDRFALWVAIKFPFTHRLMARLDDWVGNGGINPVKKWWWDLEWKANRAIVPEKGTNVRHLDLDGDRIASKQKIALYPPDVLPPPDAIGVPVKLERKEAILRGQRAESPTSARARTDGALGQRVTLRGQR